MASKRCCFLAEKQQCFDENSRLNGAYIIYDGEEKRHYYSHRDDHNGGRERLAMGVLMAYWLRRHPDKRLEWSLEQYVNYVYRELYDGNTGTVFNDIGHNLDWDRLYNYPWMAQFQLELYHLKGEEKYLSDVYRTLMQYYRKGGIHFYGIGKTVRNATDNKMKDFQELFECYYSEARVEVWDIATNKNLTERFLGEYTGVCSVEALVELFVKILCFSDRRRKG